MLDSLPSKGEDAIREVQRQRNLEQALFIQMEMQKKLHEQLEVIFDTHPTHIKHGSVTIVEILLHSLSAHTPILSALAILTQTCLHFVCMADHCDSLYMCSMKMSVSCDMLGLVVKLNLSTLHAAVSTTASAQSGSARPLHHQLDRAGGPAASLTASACSRRQPQSSPHCSRLSSIDSLYCARLVCTNFRPADTLHASAHLRGVRILPSQSAGRWLCTSATHRRSEQQRQRC